MQQPFQKVDLVLPAHRENSGLPSLWMRSSDRGYGTVSRGVPFFNTAAYHFSGIGMETAGGGAIARRIETRMAAVRLRRHSRGRRGGAGWVIRTAFIVVGLP
jgi:hypothetical protein